MNLKQQYLKLKARANKNNKGVSRSIGQLVLPTARLVFQGRFIVDSATNTPQGQAMMGPNAPRNVLIFAPITNSSSIYFINTKTWNSELIKNGKLLNNKYRVDPRGSWMTIN